MGLRTMESQRTFVCEAEDTGGDGVPTYRAFSRDGMGMSSRAIPNHEYGLSKLQRTRVGQRFT